jgi:hypothetical protein
MGKWLKSHQNRHDDGFSGLETGVFWEVMVNQVFVGGLAVRLRL